jgi:hypothetical protein
MTRKKPESKQIARARLSLVSGLLATSLRGTMQVPPAQEPWRNRKPKGKNKGGR